MRLSELTPSRISWPSRRRRRRLGVRQQRRPAAQVQRQRSAKATAPMRRLRRWRNVGWRDDAVGTWGPRTCGDQMAVKGSKLLSWYSFANFMISYRGNRGGNPCREVPAQWPERAKVLVPCTVCSARDQD